MLKIDFLLFFISLLAVVMLVIFFPVVFYENDNIGILILIKNEQVVFFMSSLLGRGLSALYSMYSEIPWFVLVLHAAHVLSIYIFFRSLYFYAELRFAEFIFIMLFYILIYSKFVMMVGYNASSILLTGNSLLSYIVATSSGKMSQKYALFLGFLFSLGFLIRMDAVFLVIMISLPLIYFYRAKLVNKTIVFFLTPVVFFVAFEYVDLGINQDSSFEDFLEFNEVRGKTSDFSPSWTKEERDNLYKIIGINNSDYLAFQQWLYFDESIFSVENIRMLSEFHYFSFEEIYIEDFFWFSNVDEKYIVLLVLMILAGFFYVRGFYKEVFVYVSYFYSFGFCMNYFLRFPSRISEPSFLLASSIIFILLVLGRENVEKSY